MDILKDARWQFIGVMVAVAFGSWWIYAYFQDKPIHELKVTILANSSLIQVDEEYSSDIEVSYNDLMVDNLSLIEVRFENTGNQPIPSSSYENPIRFQFAEEGEILQASVIESIPDDINLVISIDETHVNEATIEPVLLNAQDRVIIRFLLINVPLSNNGSTFDVDARIANIHSISPASALEEPTTTSPISPREVLSWLTGLFIGMFASIIFLLLPGSRKNNGEDNLFDVPLDLVDEATEPVNPVGSTPIIAGYLRLLDSTDNGYISREIPIYQHGTVRVGRGGVRNDHIIDNPTISRHHARIASEEGIHAIYDELSENGSFINDERLTPANPSSITYGDIVRFGTVAFRFDSVSIENENHD